MVSIKADKCPKCGDTVFKLAGRAPKLCHDTCLKCRQVERETYRAALESNRGKETDHV